MRRNRLTGREAAFIDFLVSTMIAFLAISVIAVQAVSVAHTKTANTGLLVFDIQWPIGSYSDVDLWVKSPGDQPVGFARRAGVYCDLSRDDLGLLVDKNSHAFETTGCIAIPDGEWTVNVLLYKYHVEWDKLPIPVQWHVSLNGQTIMEGRVDLMHQGDEQTAVRFATKDGKIIPGSENTVPTMLFNR